MLSKLQSLACSLGLLSVLAVAGTGCGAMAGPASASFASVVIRGHSAAEIAQTATQVFRANGYQGAGSSEEMVFTKEGSRTEQAAYGTLGGGVHDKPLLVRVKAQVVRLSDDSHRLQCQGYLLRAAGDSFFEEEQRMANSRRGPYQALLEETAKRLK